VELDRTPPANSRRHLLVQQLHERRGKVAGDVSGGEVVHHPPAMVTRLQR
jgi:hypothetical protein